MQYGTLVELHVIPGYEFPYPRQYKFPVHRERKNRTNNKAIRSARLLEGVPVRFHHAVKILAIA